MFHLKELQFKLTTPPKYNREPDLSLDSQLTTPVFSPPHPLLLWLGFWPALLVTQAASACKKVDVDSKLSKNSELPLELMCYLSLKVFRKTLHKQSIFCASCLGDLSKHKSVLALLKTSLGTTNIVLLILTLNTDSLRGRACVL